MKQRNVQDLIVVLGQALLPNAKVSPNLLRRCDKAVELQRDKNCYILNTGGDPARVGMTEAQAMRDYLVNVKCIDDSIILDETEARSTLENALYVLRILQNINGSIEDESLGNIQNLYLVTCPHHMMRSSMLFKAVFAHFDYTINIIEEPSTNAFNIKEFEKCLNKEKSGLEYYLNKKLECNNPVMGYRYGHNIPIPDEEVLRLTIDRINKKICFINQISN